MMMSSTTYVAFTMRPALLTHLTLALGGRCYYLLFTGESTSTQRFSKLPKATQPVMLEFQVQF